MITVVKKDTTEEKAERKKYLGECEYYGKKAKAFRYIYDDCWKFVIEDDKGQHVLLTY